MDCGKMGIEICTRCRSRLTWRGPVCAYCEEVEHWDKVDRDLRREGIVIVCFAVFYVAATAILAAFLY